MKDTSEKLDEEIKIMKETIVASEGDPM